MHPDTWNALVETLESLQQEVEGIYLSLAHGFGVQVPEHTNSWSKVQTLKAIDPETGKVV